MTKKRMTKTEFAGLPIGQDDSLAIMALVAQRQQIEQEAAKINQAVMAIAARVAKEAGWNVSPSELRIEQTKDGLVLKCQEVQKDAT